MKLAEWKSDQNRNYYARNRERILRKYHERKDSNLKQIVYEKRYQNREEKIAIPFIKYSTPDSECTIEHAFEFLGKDISEERKNYYLSMI